MSYYVPRGGHPAQTEPTTDRAAFTEAYAVLPRGGLGLAPEREIACASRTHGAHLAALAFAGIDTANPALRRLAVHAP